ncbi:unnamed protein product [Didymodactylos carnosus]|uniref:Wax synthase domain-containing protein n=1 Tax=Didymodactylos carnosus TaxID=1234261 RepID=A0A814DJ41_9BILA|nr:unnamed protein product [Didymodactylos carnosus]CAF1197666.1 unnamed protein product [Didymodactylos carnosus]CAF3729043.1 unnamed protein product [Didymodactylos carnosus]CAF4007880.1 unnamed protein product [Didymodactylos carnosus]
MTAQMCSNTVSKRKYSSTNIANDQNLHDSIQCNPKQCFLFDPMTHPTHMQLLSAKSTVLYVVLGSIIQMTLIGIGIDCMQYGVSALNIENALFIIQVIVYYVINIIASHLSMTCPRLAFILFHISLVIPLTLPTRRSVYRYILVSGYTLSSLRWVELLKRHHQWNGWYRCLLTMSFCDIRYCEVLVLPMTHQRRETMLTKWKQLVCNALLWISIHSVLIGVLIVILLYLSALLKYEKLNVITFLVLMAFRYSLDFVTVVESFSAIHYAYILMFSVLGVKAQCIQNAPLHAASVSELWSTRWNRYIQPLLHNHIYTPVYNRTNNRQLAVLTTFMFSGVWLHGLPAYIAGLTLKRALSIELFFVAQALLIAIEERLFIRPIANTFHTRTRTKILMLITLPLLFEPLHTLFQI